jgi:ribonuclease Y
MAEELGVDPVLARRAGLLHDIGKAFPYDVEGSHVQIGVNAAKKYKEGREVVHAIEAHHGDVEPQTVIAVLVQAADAISAARPGARREDMENYIKRLEKLEEIAEGFTGIEKAFAIQAGRELRVMVRPESVHDEDMPLIARQMAQKIQEEVKYPGQIKINLIRESRATDYAK